MNKKKPKNADGIVFSTDRSFKFMANEEPVQETISAALQKLNIRLDKKHRAGKEVTLIEGFAGTEDDLEDLGKQIKSFCGTGGSVKEGLIIIQGDQREKVFQWLIKQGFKNTRK